jgi:hypothetical protein
VAGIWNDAYLDELCMFPNGRYDDQVDASSGAFTRLARHASTSAVPQFLQVDPDWRRHGALIDLSDRRQHRFSHRHRGST